MVVVGPCSIHDPGAALEYAEKLKALADRHLQVASSSWQIFGAMIESHVVEGRQDYTTGQDARYGQSITDACLSLEATEPILEQLARAQQRRGAAVRS